jgi:hypothetical protein
MISMFVYIYLDQEILDQEIFNTWHFRLDEFYNTLFYALRRGRVDEFVCV